MANDRRYVPASEFCASVRDGTHDSPKPVQQGRKLVTSKNLTSGRLDLSNTYLISEDDFAAINKRSKVDQWDVLISMIGTVGEPCLIKEEPDFAIKNIGLFKPKSELDAKWLYYYLRSPEARHRIKEQSRGTTQQYIPLGALRDFPIPLAESLEEQKAIAHILGTLDDKIELNRRMNATLEAMARALFQSWFVDFDPVHAKAAGRHPTGMDKATAALFPSSFNADGMPEGWRMKTVSDLSEINSWTLSKKDHLGEFLEYIEISEVSRGDIGKISSYPRGEEPSRARRRLRHGDTALSTVRPNRESFFLALSPPEHRVASTGFAVVTPTKAPWSFIHIALTQPEVFERLGQLADGAAYPAVRPEVIGDLPIPVPDPDLLVKFHQLCRPLLEQAETNRTQSRTLANLRDTLLPELLGGEIISLKQENLAHEVNEFSGL